MAAVEVANTILKSAALNLSMILSSMLKLYCPSAGSSNDHEKTLTVAELMSACLKTLISSSQVSSGHCSGL